MPTADLSCSFDTSGDAGDAFGEAPLCLQNERPVALALR